MQDVDQKLLLHTEPDMSRARQRLKFVLPEDTHVGLGVSTSIVEMVGLVEGNPEGEGVSLDGLLVDSVVVNTVGLEVGPVVGAMEPSHNPIISHASSHLLDSELNGSKPYVPQA